MSAGIVTPKFSIGDEVFSAGTSSAPKRETCPDCLGERVWSCALPSGESLNIPCPTCAYGYEGSRGFVADFYEITPVVNRVTITGVRIDTNDECNPVSYSLDTHYAEYHCSGYERDLFADESAARTRAEEMAQAQREHVLEHNATHRVRRKKDRPGSLVAYLRTDIRNKQRDIKRLTEHIARLQLRHPRMKADQESQERAS